MPIAASLSPASASGVATTATSVPATMTSGGVAHTKGAWTELFASTAFNTTLIDLLAGATASSGQNRHMLCDIGIGSIGNETVLVPNIAIGCAGGIRRYSLPIWVPAGTRISVRYQTTAISLARDVQMNIYNTGNAQSDTGSSATAYGVNTGTSTATSLTNAGAINTLAAWTQITASTTSDIRALVVATQGPSATSWSAAPTALIDIGYGGSGSEVVLAERIPMSWAVTETTDSVPFTIPVNLPTGTRLVARFQASDIAQTPTVGIVGIT